MIYGSCQECICKMITNVSSILSLNCSRNNNTCELIPSPTNFGSFHLVKDPTSTFYALSLPSDDSTRAVITTTTTTTRNKSRTIHFGASVMLLSISFLRLDRSCLFTSGESKHQRIMEYKSGW